MPFLSDIEQELEKTGPGLGLILGTTAAVAEPSPIGEIILAAVLANAVRQKLVTGFGGQVIAPSPLRREDPFKIRGFESTNKPFAIRGVPGQAEEFRLRGFEPDRNEFPPESFPLPEPTSLAEMIISAEPPPEPESETNQSRIPGILEEKKFVKGPAEQVKGLLSGLPKAEKEIFGIEELTGTVTREDLLQRVRERAPVLVENWKGRKIPQEGKRDITTPEGSIVEGVLPHGTEGFDDTKFSQYQTPGGTNYREVVVTAPGAEEFIKERETLPNIEELREGLDSQFADGDISDREYELELAKIEGYTRKDIGSGVQYKSSHWDESNPLYHIRMNDRVTSDGKKTLFVEEIQSDWAREAREKGQVGRLPGDLTMKRITSEEVKDYKILGLEYKENDWGLYDSGEIMNTQKGDLEEIEAKKFFIEDSLEVLGRGEFAFLGGRVSGPIPSHPLLKNWHQNAVKKVLEIAVREGYDAVSWTTGQQQADRYDLSKQIDEIKYSKDGDLFFIEIGRAGEKVDSRTLSGEELPSFVGKEVANRILQGVGKKSLHGIKVLSGLDLQVGGEWAKNLYDRIIPKAIGKLTGGKVKVDRLAQPILHITPEIKEKVDKERLLFSKGRVEEAPTFYG